MLLCHFEQIRWDGEGPSGIKIETVEITVRNDLHGKSGGRVDPEFTHSRQAYRGFPDSPGADGRFFTGIVSFDGAA